MRVCLCRLRVFEFLYLELIFQMDFYDILKDTFTKGQSQQDITVSEVVEELKVKLSVLMEGPILNEEL